jgi:cytochrome P450
VTDPVFDLTDLDNFAGGFPHERFAELRRTQPVFFHEPTDRTPGNEGFWVLTRHADVLAAASSSNELSSHCGGARTNGGTLIEDLPSDFAAGVLLNMMDDPRHNRIRRAALPCVTPKALAQLEADLGERARTIVASAVAKRSCDFLAEVAAELPLQAIAGLMGVPQDDRHELFEWAEAMLDYQDRELGESSEQTIAANAAMFEYGHRLLDGKRAVDEHDADDILAAVIDADVSTELEQQMFFTLLVAAGTETTRNSIAVGAMALIDNPPQWAALRDDNSLLPSAVEEILRWASSTTYNRRTATRTIALREHTIEAGEKVTLWWASANRDEDVFADPSQFDVRRDPNPHVAFGHGTHFCLGANLARLEIRLMLEALLDQVERIEPDGPVEWMRTNKHNGVRHMPVELVAR